MTNKYILVVKTEWIDPSTGDKRIDHIPVRNMIEARREFMSIRFSHPGFIEASIVLKEASE